METKICSKCNLEKEISEFPKERNRCSACIREYMQEYRLRNKEKLKTSNKEYYLKNSGKIKSYYKKYWARNPEKWKKYRKKYKAENPEKIKEISKNWNAANKQKIRTLQRERNKKGRLSLDDRYVMTCLKSTSNFTFSELRKHPELIEAQRLIIKTKRLCRTSQS